MKEKKGMPKILFLSDLMVYAKGNLMNTSSLRNNPISITVLQSEPELWDLFTRKEEYKVEFCDRYQRFPYFLSRDRDILHPRASKYLIEKGLRPVYPNGKSFAVCLTHDIDIVYFTKRRLMYEASLAFRQKKISRSIKILLNKYNKNTNPLMNFDKILSLEQKYGALSSFYILALERDEKDFNFKINTLKDELKTILEKGCEVGLHAGHGTMDSVEKLKEEKNRIEEVVNQEITGCRAHFLRFKTPQTWENLKKAGFKYDTSLGYPDCIGFRNGMCHPFQPLNRNNNQFIDILEIPLVIMDDSFESYMRFDYENALKISKELIDRVKELNGVITILWHNTFMFDEYLNLYEEILSYSQNKNAWLTSGENIRKWWEEQEFIRYD